MTTMGQPRRRIAKKNLKKKEETKKGKTNTMGVLKCTETWQRKKSLKHVEEKKRSFAFFFLDVVIFFSFLKNNFSLPIAVYRHAYCYYIICIITIMIIIITIIINITLISNFSFLSHILSIVFKINKKIRKKTPNDCCTFFHYRYVYL